MHHQKVVVPTEIIVFSPHQQLIRTTKYNNQDQVNQVMWHNHRNQQDQDQSWVILANHWPLLLALLSPPTLTQLYQHQNQECLMQHYQCVDQVLQHLVEGNLVLLSLLTLLLVLLHMLLHLSYLLQVKQIIMHIYIKVLLSLPQ